MTTPLIVNIPHTLGREEATRRLKRGLARASSTIPIVKIEEETGSGDHLSFKISGMGQQAFGTAEVNDADVRIELVLPWLLQRLGEMVQGAIRSRAQILLEKK
jgi:Putative polyhydroxyalkanoic acid system protein (PHA_gran_rgn)